MITLSTIYSSYYVFHFYSQNPSTNKGVNENASHVSFPPPHNNSCFIYAALTLNAMVS